MLVDRPSADGLCCGRGNGAVQLGARDDLPPRPHQREEERELDVGQSQASRAAPHDTRGGVDDEVAQQLLAISPWEHAHVRSTQQCVRTGGELAGRAVEIGHHIGAGGNAALCGLVIARRNQDEVANGEPFIALLLHGRQPFGILIRPPQDDGGGGVFAGAIERVQRVRLDLDAKSGLLERETSFRHARCAAVAEDDEGALVARRQVLLGGWRPHAIIRPAALTWAGSARNP